MWAPKPALSHPLSPSSYKIYRSKSLGPPSPPPQPTCRRPKWNPKLSISQCFKTSPTECSAPVGNTKAVGRRAVGKKEEVWSCLSRGVAMATGRRQQKGWKKGTVTVRGQGPKGVLLPRFVSAGCSCLLCPLWMKPLIVVPGAVSQKCVMRKRQDVNVLSRKKKNKKTPQFYGQMSWDRRVKKNQTGFFLQEVSEHGYCMLRMSVRAPSLAAFPELVWTWGRTPGGASV